MAVSFNQIPGNLRVPLMWLELNAGTAAYASNSRLLLIGQKTSAGSAVVEEPILVTGSSDGLFGKGSQLSVMYKQAVLTAPFQEIWCLPLADAVGATAAAARITVAGAPVSVAGTIALYVAGQRIPVNVTTAMSSASIASAIAAAVNASAVPIEATAAVTTVGTRPTATAATTGPATAAGVASITINGATYSVPVAAGDTSTTVNAALASVLGANGFAGTTSTGSAITVRAPDEDVAWGAKLTSATVSSTATGYTLAAPVLATAGVSPVVTLTARNKGALSNKLNVDVNLRSDDSPLGPRLLTIVDFAGGAGDPDLTIGLSNLGDELFDFIASPYSDTANVALIEAFLDARWGPISSLYGNYVSFRDDTAAGLATYGAARNNPNVCVYGAYNFQSPPWRVAAALGALHAAHLQSAPELSRPLQTLALPGVRGPKLTSDRFGTSVQNTLLYSGISTLMFETDGTVAVGRAITTYQSNAWGSPDASWLSVNTRAQQMYGMRYLKSYITSTYPRCALVDSNPNNLQNFVTADDIRKAFVHAYKKLVAIGVYENLDTFEELLIVERNASDANRIDVFAPTDVVNQLIVLATNVTSYLQYSDA